jgi:hypothetical protein
MLCSGALSSGEGFADSSQRDLATTNIAGGIALLKRRPLVDLLAGGPRDDLSSLSRSQGLGSRPSQRGREVPDRITAKGPPVNRNRSHSQ